MFDNRADFIIELIEKVNAIINEMHDGVEFGCTSDELDSIVELAEQVRDELEQLVDE